MSLRDEQAREFKERMRQEWRDRMIEREVKAFEKIAKTLEESKALKETGVSYRIPQTEAERAANVDRLLTIDSRAARNLTPPEEGRTEITERGKVYTVEVTERELLVWLKGWRALSSPLVGKDLKITGAWRDGRGFVFEVEE